jgi:hypothetical protein
MRFWGAWAFLVEEKGLKIDPSGSIEILLAGGGW